MLASLWRRLVALVARRRLLDDLDEELQGHFDELCLDLQNDGYPPREAARLARLRLGGAIQLRESARDEWRLPVIEGATDDLRLAWRSLTRRRGFVVAATTTLALGVGASTAIFSVAWGISLRPLPYPEPERLVRIYESNPANGETEHDVSNPVFHEWRTGAASIQSAAMYSRARRRFLAGNEQRPVTTMTVSPAFFEVFGAAPLLGQGFRPEREYTRFTLHEVVLSHAAWQRLFGGDPNVIGRSIRFAGDDDPWRVVGVMPDSFAFSEPVDLWQPQIVELPLARLIRNWRYERVVARLRPGATSEQAQAELEAVAARLAREFPTIHGGWTARVRSLHASVVGDFGRVTWLLLAAVAVVLLVASVNVGGLLAARASTRARELAVRVALGAGSWRLVRLWLAEACLLGALGVAGGLLLAWGGIAVLTAAAPPGIPRLDEIGMDRAVLLVAFAAGGLAVTVFSIAPLRSARHPASDRLRIGWTGAGEPAPRQRAARWLSIAQSAGATALVVLAIMLARSFVNLMAVDPGWNPSGVLSLTVSPPIDRDLRRPWYRYLQWSDELVARLEATPGIERAAITTEIPLRQDAYPTTLARGRGKNAGDQARWPGIEHLVTDGYFDLMELRLNGGRSFQPTDRFSEAQLNWTRDTERGVAIVSESTARLLWPGQSAVGQALWLPDGDNVQWREIVGVVEDMQFHAMGEAPALHVFVPWTQHVSGRPRLLVKGAGGVLPSAAVVRQVVVDVQPGTTVDEVRSLEALVRQATAQSRFTSRLVGSFATLALVLAAVGIYGTLSYLVGARERELGIRIALGAPRHRVVASVLEHGLAPAVAGGLAGSAVAIGIARSFDALLFRLEPLDAASLLGGTSLLFAVATLAALAPALRASRVDPVRVLRGD